MNVIVNGAGIGGLVTSILLGADGHDVTLLERDAAPVPDPEEAWEGWSRRGVNQFRLPHFFLPRFLSIVRAEFPELETELEKAGMLRLNIIDIIPEQMTGGRRPEDDEFDVITGRRSVYEAVVAAFAECAKGVTVRRGTAVAGLETGPSAGSGPRHVSGVRTESGELLAADLVVDTTGRRSPLPRWLSEIGAEPPHEELEDCGFTYYGRHFRSDDGSTPGIIAPINGAYGSVNILTLPSDNGTWSVVLVTSSRDTALRKVRDAKIWTDVLRSFPLVAHWLDGTPLEDEVVTMSKIEDRHRRFSGSDGEPVATGVVSVADSWACTNPSLGRGASMGALHALALRDVLRSSESSDPLALARAFNRGTEEVVEPWYRSTLAFDRHRLNAVHAAIDGGEYDPTGDASWTLGNALNLAAANDPDCLRALFSVIGLLRTPEELFADEGFTAKVLSLGGEADGDDGSDGLGPDRVQLLEMVSA
jgi:2-polyprenyl-6-methoxyphenol hydroxylase-like FAD-dependent oxidoreductase